MAILGHTLDYTDKDFDSLRARLFSLIGGVFPGWTARQIANFGDLLLELNAHIGDVLTKYQDNQAGESRWSTATQRKSLIAMAKLIGYAPPTATASLVDVTVSFVAPVAGDVVVPAGTVVRTKQVSTPVTFRVLADIVIPAGATSASGTAENSEPQDELVQSPGVANLEVRLQHTPFLDGSLAVSAGDGVYSQVDNFLASTALDRHYTVGVDQNDAATVRFGNGVNGSIPSGTIFFGYKTGGGSTGVVEADTVRVVEGVFTDSFGTPVQLSVTNPEASNLAVDRPTVEQIRAAAPESIRVLERTVAREDYEINARAVAGVARALMLTSNQDGAIGENTGYLFIVPVGGGAPTQALKDAVFTMCTVTKPNTLTFRLLVDGALYKTIDVAARVWLRKGASATTTRNTILSNLAAYFQIQNDDGTPNTNVDFGFGYVESEGDAQGELPLSDLFDVVRDTVGVRKIGDAVTDFQLNGEHSDVSLLLREFPRLGTVTLINGETDSPL